MVRVHTDTQTIMNLYAKNTDTKTYGPGDRIEIASDFQRGDEETGVWTPMLRKHYIDSLVKKFPTGIVTMVKDHLNDTSCLQPWKVLDGANRVRAIRDYILDKFTDEEGKKYSELNPQERADFNTVIIPCQWLTLVESDPANTISQMFTRLNRNAKSLSHGELFKAHGWKKDVWQIEMAKKFIGDTWSSNFPDPTNQISNIRPLWNSTFGADLCETKRCDNLAMMLGYIFSAMSARLENFDKRYDKNEKLLSVAGEIPSRENICTICTKIERFLKIMKKIYNPEIFGRITKGMPSQLKTAPVWFRICDNTMTQAFEEKLVKFYQVLPENPKLREEFDNVLTEGSNGETTDGKIGKTLEFIEKYKLKRT
jgi:hypothetical protein